MNKNKYDYDKVFSSIGSIEIQKKIDLYEATEPESNDFIHTRQSAASVRKTWDKMVVHKMALN